VCLVRRCIHFSLSLSLQETLAHICDYADVGMSVRGQYYPNNKEVPAGDRKLFLQIESLTERGLQLAKAEVARLIKEEMMKMVSFVDMFILLITTPFHLNSSKIQLYNWSIVVVTKCCSLAMLLNMRIFSSSSMFCKIELCLTDFFSPFCGSFEYCPLIIEAKEMT
jgi:hypothetical protein